MLREGDVLEESEQSPPVRRGPGRPSRSNAELLDLSLDLFFEHGFERTSIDAICAAAGMAKRTVYARYGDKTTLFKAALKRAIERWIVPVGQLRVVETGDLDTSLLNIARILVANIISPAGLRLMRLTNAESGRMPDIGVYTVKHGTEPTVAYLTELFHRHLDRDGIPFEHAEDAAMAFLHLVVGGSGNNFAWGLEMDSEAVERHTRYCVELFLHGLLPPSGDSAGAMIATQLEMENLRLKKLLAEKMIELDQVREAAG